MDHLTRSLLFFVKYILIKSMSAVSWYYEYDLEFKTVKLIKGNDYYLIDFKKEVIYLLAIGDLIQF